MYGLTAKGWIDSNTFEGWFTGHFLKYAPSVRPLLLLIDGHSTHYNPAVIRMAAEHDIIVFCLPPNTTHLLQPLDRSSFGSLKSNWQDECRRFTRETGKFVTRNNFSVVFAAAWSRAMTIKNVVACFKVTGTCPFNRDAVHLLADDKRPAIVFIRSTSRLTFVPIISPSPDRSKAAAVLAETAHQRQTSSYRHQELTCESASAHNAVTNHGTTAFTVTEERVYQERFNNGYDLTIDERYNRWVKEKSQKADRTSQTVSNVSVPPLPLSDRIVSSQRSTQLQRLELPPLPEKPAPTRPVIARVLTSAENIKMLEEKSQTKRTGKGVKTVKKPTVAKDVTIVAAKQSAKSTEVDKIIQPKLRRLRSKGSSVITDIFLETKTGRFSSASLPPP